MVQYRAVSKYTCMMLYYLRYDAMHQQQQLLLLLHRITNCIQRHADQHMQQYVIVIAEYLADSRYCGLGNIITVCNIIYI